MNKKILKIRAHHFLCMQGFQGYGYSDSFVEHMTKIITDIKENSECNIKLINYCDDICKACNNNINGKCIDYKKISKMDNLLLIRLNLQSEQVISAANVLHLVNEKLQTIEAANEICSTCCWKEKCLWFMKRLNYSI